MSLVVGFAVLGAGGGVAAAEVPNPTAEGPVEGGTHGYPWNHSLVPLSGDGYDYTEREFFYGGTATNLTSGATAPYKSRMLVRLPSDPAKFTGIVVVEWLNVTASYDLETGWPTPGPEWLMRQGVGYVGVSAQLVGVCCGQGSLKGWDPPRYAPLVHPGDDFSYDIFSQAVEALRDPANNGAPGADPMSGLPAKKIVATGASQSASRLTDFVNDGYDRDTIDLFLITRGGGPYTDFSTPIFMLNEENNEIPQPDSPQLVGWEEAGTAHAPKHWEDYADATAERDLAAPSPLAAVAQQCSINRGSVDYSSRAMSYWVKEYLEKGTLPPSAPRMRRDESGGLVRDDNGLAQGGLRHPFIEVPVAFNSGEGCVLWGEYREWEPEKIRSMYPTHCEYVSRVTEWANHEVEKGWLLPEDRDDAIAKAVAFGDPWPNEPLDACRGAAVAAAQAPPAAGQPPSPPARPCAGTGLGIRGTRVGPAALGRRRRAQRRKIGLRRSRSRRRYDVYCAGSPDRLRIAYAPRRLGRKLRGRAVVVLTANPLIAADGVAPRANEETLRRQLVGERRIRVGRTTWYLGRRGAARLVYRVRLGRVVEVGVANRRLFAKPRSARRTLRVLGL